MQAGSAAMFLGKRAVGPLAVALLCLAFGIFGFLWSGEDLRGIYQSVNWIKDRTAAGTGEAARLPDLEGLAPPQGKQSTLPASMGATVYVNPAWR